MAEATFETLYAAGWGSVRIAALYGVSHSFVLRRLRAAGVEIRPAGRPPRRLTPAERVRLLELYADRVPFDRIAGELNVSVDTLRKLVRAAALEPRPHPSRLRVDPDELVRIAALYEQGLTLDAIGRTIGMHPKAVRRRLKFAAIEPRPRSSCRLRVDPDELVRIAALHEQGLSQAAIGRTIGMHPKTVGRRLKLALAEKKTGGRAGTARAARP